MNNMKLKIKYKLLKIILFKTRAKLIKNKLINSLN